MNKSVKILTITASIIGALATILTIFYNLYQDLNKEKLDLKETLTNRTISYYENLTYYQNELGQTVRESEICETKQRIVNEQLQYHVQIINEYEQLVDSVHNVVLMHERKEPELLNLNNITKPVLNDRAKPNKVTINKKECLKTHESKKRFTLLKKIKVHFNTLF